MTASANVQSTSFATNDQAIIYSLKPFNYYNTYNDTLMLDTILLCQDQTELFFFPQTITLDNNGNQDLEDAVVNLSTDAYPYQNQSLELIRDHTSQTTITYYSTIHIPRQNLSNASNNTISLNASITDDNLTNTLSTLAIYDNQTICTFLKINLTLTANQSITQNHFMQNITLASSTDINATLYLTTVNATPPRSSEFSSLHQYFIIWRSKNISDLMPSITLAYDTQNNLGIDETTIVPFSYDDGTWNPILPFTKNMDENIVQFPALENGVFALFAIPTDISKGNGVCVNKWVCSNWGEGCSRSGKKWRQCVDIGCGQKKGGPATERSCTPTIVDGEIVDEAIPPQEEKPFIFSELEIDVKSFEVIPQEINVEFILKNPGFEQFITLETYITDENNRRVLRKIEQAFVDDELRLIRSYDIERLDPKEYTFHILATPQFGDAALYTNKFTKPSQPIPLGSGFALLLFPLIGLYLFIRKRMLKKYKVNEQYKKILLLGDYEHIREKLAKKLEIHSYNLLVPFELETTKRAYIEEITNKEQWIIQAKSLQYLDLALDRSDLIIILSPPLILRMLTTTLTIMEDKLGLDPLKSSLLLLKQGLLLYKDKVHYARSFTQIMKVFREEDAGNES